LPNMENDPIKLSKAIKDQALALGFDDCGIVQAVRLDNDAGRLKEWLDDRLHADMQYMQNNFEKRIDPRELLPGAKSLIVVLLNYFPSVNLDRSGNYIISKYAYGQDYHKVVKRKLRQLQKFLIEHYNDSNSRIFVDSAPVLERSWAALAGLGWVGKNANLISQKKGSFFFIGEIISTLTLAADNPVKDHCGSCTRCIEACPTGAIVSPKKIDSNRCISYWTIENKGPINTDLKGKFKDQIFGCDICQDVCPWNSKTGKLRDPELQPSPDLIAMKKHDWQNLKQEQFDKLFDKSPVKRIKYEGLMRNIDFLRE
jgi:epoxyqueuosine reductase